ncbi:uncharacterized protein [Parasteatoda tepidariorum]|uniref:uncharacterized protein n=1 Tax=Parasteatoda tepidariorum TaxID=114398 RepID=UPI001C719508|nr:uncharacterized protein LOC107444885 [Parasteatoda tepidariorum]
MKQGSVDADNIESGYRFNFHRRKMLKNSSVLIGDAENIDRAIARELNYAVAAAFHDHLSCTKSAQQFCTIDTISNDVILNNNLACKIDHIYANCSDSKNITTATPDPPVSDEIPSNKLRTNFDQNRQENRVCLLRKRLSKPSVETTRSVSECKNLEYNNVNNNSACILSTGTQHINTNLPVLATRYFGRRSKTVPSRALKRRYLGPPKNLPVQREALISTPPPVLEKEDNVINNQETLNDSEENNDNSTDSKILKKRGKKPKKILVKRDYLTTESTYFVADNWTLDSYKPSPIDVPLWKLKPIPSFYQMEGTENINDPVFQRRHLKCEMDERRRKRWDMQRLREQKVSQKLKNKNSKESSGGEIIINQKSNSFYPNPLQIEYIEVTDVLPVLAFGCAIPLFQPCEFSLPWSCIRNEDSRSSSNYKGKKSRLSSHASRVT